MSESHYVIMELESKLEELEDKLKIAVEALGYYANPKTMTGPLMARDALREIQAAPEANEE